MAKVDKEREIREVIEEIKRMWASTLAKLDNTSGRRGFDMQMEFVEEMCASKIEPRLDALLCGIQSGNVDHARHSLVGLSVVDDPRELTTAGSLPAAVHKTRRRGHARAPGC